ncbi:hypothetical protein BDP27DRAFT_1444075 [Rhodocollybia butyracea]|uniref:Uncharacterized protein n=1 Tax=Rhodocollybia butyracea TaxID=206335 RepID=A0A9P5UCZ9_9AGAR|nr:hypothetical protein BDP27DRAFT_1444075 [Rhodocollybia butyracea]
MDDTDMAAVLMKALDDCQGRVTALERQLKDVDNLALSNLKHKVTQLEAELKQAGKQNEALQSEIAILRLQYKDLNAKKQETRLELDDLRMKLTSLERYLTETRVKENLPTTALARIQTLLQFLPRIQDSSRNLSPGLKKTPGFNIQEYLRRAAPYRLWSEKSYFILQESTITQCGSDQHYLTCSPMAMTIPGTNFFVESTYDKLHGQSRELFAILTFWPGYLRRHLQMPRYKGTLPRGCLCLRAYLPVPSPIMPIITIPLYIETSPRTKSSNQASNENERDFEQQPNQARRASHSLLKAGITTTSSKRKRWSKPLATTASNSRASSGTKGGEATEIRNHYNTDSVGDTTSDED